MEKEQESKEGFGFADSVMCASSSYEEKYYFNDKFTSLPKSIKEELQIMCVTYTAEVGGILTLSFDEEGQLFLSTTAVEGDLLYDEIGANLLLKRVRQEKEELFEGLEMYYQNFDFLCI